MVALASIEHAPRSPWLLPTLSSLMSDPTIVTTTNMLARMLDPKDPEGALAQEVERVGIAGILEEATHWLRPGEQLPLDFEADIRLAVANLDVSASARD